MRANRWIWIVGTAVAVLGLSALCATSFALAVFGADAVLQRPAVAIVRVEGQILPGDAPDGLFGGGAYAERITRQLRALQRNPAVKAVVLRVDSPGGEVVASDEIAQEVRRTREAGKKVVVSMGSLAASGGYYVSAGADRILANPTTTTGSIGVIGVIPNAQELLSTLGIQVQVIKSGPFKDEGSLFRPLTDEERAIFQRMIDEAYEQFVQVIAEGRKLDPARVREIGDGRIYTGLQARQLGLIDEFGDLRRAIQVAAELAGIKGEPRVIDTRRASPLAALFGALLRPAPRVTLADLFGLQQRFTMYYLYLEL
jgi:protease-4